MPATRVLPQDYKACKWREATRGMNGGRLCVYPDGGVTFASETVGTLDDAIPICPDLSVGIRVAVEGAGAPANLGEVSSELADGCDAMARALNMLRAVEGNVAVRIHATNLWLVVHAFVEHVESIPAVATLDADRLAKWEDVYPGQWLRHKNGHEVRVTQWKSNIGTIGDGHWQTTGDGISVWKYAVDVGDWWLLRMTAEDASPLGDRKPGTGREVRASEREAAEPFDDPGETTSDIEMVQIERETAGAPTMDEVAVEDEERIYPCDGCGTMRTKAEGGTTFTVCDECWNKHRKKAAGAEDKGPTDAASALLVDVAEAVEDARRESQHVDPLERVGVFARKLTKRLQEIDARRKARTTR